MQELGFEKAYSLAGKEIKEARNVSSKERITLGNILFTKEDLWAEIDTEKLCSKDWKFHKM